CSRSQSVCQGGVNVEGGGSWDTLHGQFAETADQGDVARLALLEMDVLAQHQRNSNRRRIHRDLLAPASLMSINLTPYRFNPSASSRAGTRSPISRITSCSPSSSCTSRATWSGL